MNSFSRMPRPWGIEFVKGKVARIDPAENGTVKLHYEDQGGDGGVQVAEHDLVVLSLGMVSGWDPEGVCSVSKGSDAFIKTVKPKIAPTLTDMDGVFVAGVAAGPKDIVDTIVEAGAAAMETSKHLVSMERTRKAAA